VTISWYVGEKPAVAKFDLTSSPDGKLVSSMVRTGKEVWHDDIVFARSGADAYVTTDAQDTPAFSRYCSRIGQMMIDLRHKHEIDAAVHERKLVS